VCTCNMVIGSTSSSSHHSITANGCSSLYDCFAIALRMIRIIFLLFLLHKRVFAGMAPSTPPDLPENVSAECRRRPSFSHHYNSSTHVFCCFFTFIVLSKRNRYSYRNDWRWVGEAWPESRPLDNATYSFSSSLLLSECMCHWQHKDGCKGSGCEYQMGLSWYHYTCKDCKCVPEP
jgi:hypothetical protein